MKTKPSITLSDDTVLSENTISFCNQSKRLLTIEPDGNIIWDSPKGEIVIEDKPLLGFALLDLVIQMTSSRYDYSLLGEELMEEYTKFLDSGKE